MANNKIKNNQTTYIYYLFNKIKSDNYHEAAAYTALLI